MGWRATLPAYRGARARSLESLPRARHPAASIGTSHLHLAPPRMVWAYWRPPRGSCNSCGRHIQSSATALTRCSGARGTAWVGWASSLPHFLTSYVFLELASQFGNFNCDAPEGAERRIQAELLAERCRPMTPGYVRHRATPGGCLGPQIPYINA